MDWQKVRNRAYLILLALQPVVLYYGLAKEQEVTLWFNVIVVSFGLGAAARYSAGDKTVESKA